VTTQSAQAADFAITHPSQDRTNLAEPSEVSMVALIETRERRAVELLREERAGEVKEAMASTYGGGMTKNWVAKRFSKDFAKEVSKPQRPRSKKGGSTGVRRTSVLAFEPLFAYSSPYGCFIFGTQPYHPQ
jgi:hypothetical protein